MVVGVLVLKLGITKLSGWKGVRNDSYSIGWSDWGTTPDTFKNAYLDSSCELFYDNNGASSGPPDNFGVPETDIHYKIVSIDSERSNVPLKKSVKPTIVAELVKYTPIETITYTKGSNYYGKISSTDVNYKTTNCRNDDGYFYIYTGIE